MEKITDYIVMQYQLQWLVSGGYQRMITSGEVAKKIDEEDIVTYLKVVSGMAEDNGKPHSEPSAKIQARCLPNTSQKCYWLNQLLGAEVDFTILDQREESRLVKGQALRTKENYLYISIFLRYSKPSKPQNSGELNFWILFACTHRVQAENILYHISKVSKTIFMFGDLCYRQICGVEVSPCFQEIN
jgi:hypothetical protein